MASEKKAVRVSGETVTVDVQYDFMTEVVSVAIWSPKSQADIDLAISNREVSERARLDQEALNRQLAAEIESEIS